MLRSFKCALYVTGLASHCAVSSRTFHFAHCIMEWVWALTQPPDPGVLVVVSGVDNCA